MTTQIQSPSGVTRTGTGVLPLLTAVGFVLAYFATEVLVSGTATAALPLPNSSSAAVREWFTDNPLAAVLMGASQGVSVLFLAAYVGAVGSRRSRPWGFAAVALMLLSSVCAWVLAVVAPTASLGITELLRDTNFVTGGTAHVLTLALFVALTARDTGYGRPLRLLGLVALTAGVLSLSSLVVFEGAAFILLGRLLCMVWVVGAAVSLLRRPRGVSS